MRSDIERKRFFKQLSDDELYSSKTTEQTYHLLGKLAKKLLHAGFSVIIDATFLKQAQRQQFINLCEQLNVALTILNVTCSQNTLEKRIIQRQQHKDNISDADVSVAQSQILSQQPLSNKELSMTIAVNNEFNSKIKAI